MSRNDCVLGLQTTRTETSSTKPRSLVQRVAATGCISVVSGGHAHWPTNNTNAAAVKRIVESGWLNTTTDPKWFNSRYT